MRENPDAFPYLVHRIRSLDVILRDSVSHAEAVLLASSSGLRRPRIWQDYFG